MGGYFAYYGIAQHLQLRVALGLQHQYYPIIRNKCNISNLLTMSVNIDGLPVHSSSNRSLWPILGILNQSKDKTPFVIALFEGPSKPTNANEFLSHFVEEVTFLENNGIIVGEQKYSFVLSCIIADAPARAARAFLTCTLSHTARHGCSKCCQVGS